MADIAQRGKPAYSYLRFVRLGQLEEFKDHVQIWLTLSFLSVIFGAKLDRMLTSLQQSASFVDFVPRRFWVWLGIAVLSWVLRGKTIPITLPELDFVAWIFLNVWLGGAAIAYAYLPWWDGLPIYWALLYLGYVYERLVAIGKENYETIVQKIEDVPLRA